MMFPDKLTLVVRDRETGLPVNGIAILLVLFAVKKNDYHVGPLTRTKRERRSLHARNVSFPSSG